MSLVEPQPGVLIDPAHPLARGLSMAWMLNEGAGGLVRDCVRLQAATADEPPTWHADRCDFNGSDQYFIGPISFDGEGSWSVLMKVSVESLSNERSAFGFSNPDVGSRFTFGYYLSGGNAYFRALLRQDDNTNVINAITGDALSYGEPHWLGLVFDPDAGHYHCYVDGQAIADGNTLSYASITLNQVTIGCASYYSTTSGYWPGSIYSVYVYDRALTPGEVAQLYRRPYALFRHAVASLPIWSASPVYDLAGSIDAGAACSATAKVTRRLTGTSAANSQTSASLSQTHVVSLSGSVQAVASLAGSAHFCSASATPQAAWSSDALFGGMTAQAFKLGTALTRGWFWMRPTGCSAVYRGPTLDEMDFANILCVVDRDTRGIALPAYLSHEPGLTYCYVVHRFNSCGHQELTTAAAVTVAIGPDGQLAAPVPNGVFGLTARPTGGNCVELRWFYCPLGQKVAPRAFKVYGDDATVLGTISYRGRRLYRFQTDPLTEGRHAFGVRAESADGSESATMSAVRCAIGAQSPPAPTLLTVEAVL